jgi:predicted dehydrogenase
VKQAVLSGRHAFVAVPQALASKQLLALHEAAQRRNRVVMLDTLVLGDEHYALVRKMTSGAKALWRPRYVRMLRSGGAGRQTLDEVAAGEIAAALELVGALPGTVSAYAPRIDDETGAPDVAFVTLAFDGGLVARVDVSLLEPAQRRETVVACEGRTFVLDALEARTPLQIQASARHRGPESDARWGETVSEYPVDGGSDRHASVVEAFVAAVRGCDVVAGNALALARAALTWETARDSIARGGEPLPLPSAPGIVEGQRPELQLIRGRGLSSGREAGAPELTLVSGN